MKYIRKFENIKKDRLMQLIGYPEGNIIEVTKDEFAGLRAEEFTILWDDEEEWKDNGETLVRRTNTGHWSYNNDEDEEIEEWLKCFRDPICRDAKKYNL